MQLTPGSTVIRIDAGETATLSLGVRNTSPVIDRVTAEVVGLPGSTLVSDPPALTLFPDSDGRLSLGLTPPVDLLAGRHPFLLSVGSQRAPRSTHHVELELVVAESRRLSLVVTPARVRARREGRFTVTCRNEGNTPLDVLLTAADAERVVSVQVPADPVLVQPGGSVSAVVVARGPRLLTGGDVDRMLVVTATASDVVVTAPALLRQRPLVSRGLLTVLVLLGIVVLWAAAFLFGLNRVFAGDPVTKTAPAAFFQQPGQADGKAAGAVTKDGPLPAGAGASVSGSVVAANTQLGVGRVVVQALRVAPTGPVLFSSAATGADGSYTLVGLLPGSDYLLRFTTPGYGDVYYPTAPDVASAVPVRLGAQEARPAVDVVLSGLPASISGSVDTGDAPVRPVVTVTATSLLGTVPGAAATTTTDAAGAYVLPSLPSPDSYQLTFTAAGYGTTTVTEDVAGGEARQMASVGLDAQNGSVIGTVCAERTAVEGCAGARALGGVTVTTVVDGRQVTTTTPTQGGIGGYTLTGLVTPGTYVVTYSLPGYGARTQVVQLGPHQQAKVDVGLANGSGGITGRAFGPDGTTPLAGVTVTLGGAPTSLSTVTLTGGGTGRGSTTASGSFTLNGVPEPGSYSLTFSLTGYTSTTLSVQLSDAQPVATGLTAILVPSTGRLTGVVRTGQAGSSAVLGGVTVSLTDGQTVRSVASVDDGSFLLSSLPALPGPDGTAYTVTFSKPGYQDKVVGVRVRQNATTTVPDVVLVAS